MSNARQTTEATEGPADDESASTGDGSKRESQKQALPRGARIRIAEVLKALALDEKGRADAMGRFKASGGSLDTWGPGDVRAMADAITHAEDAMEFRPGATGAKTALRDVRRRLEAWGFR